MQELQLEPGRRYRGSFWVNDYGELHVRPEQKGSKPGNMKIVLETEMFSLCESKNLFKVTVKFNKPNLTVVNMTNVFMFIITQISQYIKK